MTLWWTTRLLALCSGTWITRWPPPPRFANTSHQNIVVSMLIQCWFNLYRVFWGHPDPSIIIVPISSFKWEKIIVSSTTINLINLVFNEFIIELRGIFILFLEQKLQIANQNCVASQTSAVYTVSVTICPGRPGDGKPMLCYINVGPPFMTLAIFWSTYIVYTGVLCDWCDVVSVKILYSSQTTSIA